MLIAGLDLEGAGREVARVQDEPPELLDVVHRERPCRPHENVNLEVSHANPRTAHIMRTTHSKQGFPCPKSPLIKI